MVIKLLCKKYHERRNRSGCSGLGSEQSSTWTLASLTDSQVVLIGLEGLGQLGSSAPQ